MFKKNSFLIIIIILFIIIFYPLQNIESTSDKEKEISNQIKTLSDGTKYIVHPSELKSGGPPKGGIGFDKGIPSLTNLKFETSEVSWMNDDDLILGLNYKGIVKAYPNKILTWHEIANDLIKNESIIITYCPLCMSGLAFKSTINNENVRFGVSGKLMNSNLVMYDELTESYWNQLTGQAIIGKLTGTTLQRIPIIPTTWGDWKEKYPETLVLSIDTGFSRNYSYNPYTDYFNNNDTFGTQFNDNRLNVKEIVFPVDIENEIKVYSKKIIEKKKIINDIVGGQKIIVLWDTELNTARIFKTEKNFTTNSKEIIDELKEDEFQTFNTYWFSWISFKPESKVYK